MAHHPSSVALHLTWISVGLLLWIHQSKGMSRWFNPELCCGQTPLAANDHQRRCCGGNISYSSFDSMCCWESTRGHYTVPIPPPQTTPSSGEEDAADVQLNSNSVFQSKFESLHDGNRNSARFLSCCGDSVYDFRFYVCCQGIIRKQRVAGNTGCCGRDTYDPYVQLCCDGDILPKPNFSSYCCGKRSYDRNVQVCCNGVIHDLPTTDDSNSINCCGHQIYDNRRQLCCNGQRLDKISGNSYCCGATQFNWEKQLCCKGGDVIDKVTPTQFCCGSKTFDMSTHMCCNDHIIRKDVLNTTIVKRAPALSHLLRSQHPLIVDDEELLCCGNRAYKYEDEMCCHGHVVQRQQSDGKPLKCCGSVTYNDETQICCDGTVSDKLTRAEDCCGSRVFNVQTQVCCQQVIHDVTSDTLLYCCGNSTFDPQTETCCGGKKMLRATVSQTDN